MKRIFIIIFVLFFFTNCANATNTEYLNIDFWNRFNDKLLVENLQNVYQNNNDLKAATMKINEANRIVKMSFANELPHFGFQGYVGQIFHSSDEVFGSEQVIHDYTQAHFLLPITMNYEVDIWGQNHLRTKAKKKQFEMVKQDEKSAYIYISSVFAADYYNLVRVDKLIEYQQKLIDLQEDVIGSYQLKYEFGTATLSDIEIAQKNLTYMQENLRKLKEKQDILQNQLSLILADVKFDKISRVKFDDIKSDIKVPKQINSEILENRPDRVKSQLDLEKIGLDVRIAKKDLLPKLIITGDIGFNMYSIASSNKFFSNIGIVPSWDLFTGGRKLQMMKLQKDRYEIALQHYEKTIIASMQESNDALYSLKTAENIDKIAKKRLNSDLTEMKRTVEREDAGTADNLDLLLHEQKVIISKMDTVTSKINEIISAINLYQALGGVDFMTSENI